MHTDAPNVDDLIRDMDDLLIHIAFNRGVVAALNASQHERIMEIHRRVQQHIRLRMLRGEPVGRMGNED